MRGPTGPSGPQGERGTPGIRGLPGADGALGPKGQTGERGAVGGQGIKGNSGEAGRPGPAGLQGLRGPVGRPGSPGKAGSPGERGIQGADGKTGEQGPQGLQGLPGPMGLQGDKGITVSNVLRYYVSLKLFQFKNIKLFYCIGLPAFSFGSVKNVLSPLTSYGFETRHWQIKSDILYKDFSVTDYFLIVYKYAPRYRVEDTLSITMEPPIRTEALFKIAVSFQIGLY